MPRERSEQTRSKPEGLSGISDTGRGHGCPCGRVHRRKARRPVKGRVVAERLPDAYGVIEELRSTEVYYEVLAPKVYEAFAAGKVSEVGGRKIVNYHGNCESPRELRQNASKGGLFVTWKVRCRECKPCLRARQFYWSRTAMDWTEWTAQQGRRTWFGTLTLSAAAQAALLDEARSRWLEENATSSKVPDWWEEPHCDERFRLCRNVLTEWVQRYWKRLRKGGAQFKYFLVFERHKSGLPHIHWLLHELGEPIRLKQLSNAWPHGFTKVKLVKGNDVRRVAFYVSKYLSKSAQSRQIASLRYAKERPSISNGSQSP